VSHRTQPPRPVPHTHHDEDEHHDHGAVRGRVLHALSELVGGHSHDAGEQIDSALESDAAGRRALLLSLVGLAVTAAVQAVVVAVSGSVALLGAYVPRLSAATIHVSPVGAHDA
jgi:hypothetical protein